MPSPLILLTSSTRTLATSAQKLSFRRATRRQRQHATLSNQPPPTDISHTSHGSSALASSSSPAAAPSIDASTLTPMMHQWSTLKAQHPSHLLLFRLGDFYELFYQDAVTASALLSLTLTSRLSIPMCGFPHYGLPQQLRKLLAANTTAAVCEQTETVLDRQKRVGKGKGVVERDVVRIVTKGTLVEEGWLNPKHFNFLLALYSALGDADGKLGTCWLDVSTGVFEHGSVPTASALSHELARLQPVEVLLPPSLAQRADIQRLLAGYTTTVRDEAVWSEDLTGHIHSWQQLAEERRRQATDGADDEQLQAEADADTVPPLLAPPTPPTAADASMTELHPADLLLQCNGVELRACSAVLDYLLYTHRKALPRLFSLPSHPDASSPSSSAVMWIDAITRRSLELTHSSSRQTRTGSLLHTIDHTLTSAGARLLSSHLASPLTTQQAINERLDMVEWAFDDRGLMDGIRGRLKQVEDVQRGVQRIVMRKGGGGAREMRGIVRSIEKGREIAQLLQSSCTMRRQSGRVVPPSIQPLLTLLTHPSLQSLAALLDSAIVDEPPALLEYGGFIRHSYHAPLATLSSSSVSSQESIDALQARYRRVLGLATLKIKKNTGIGYYIEVSAAKAERLEEERSALRLDEGGGGGEGGSERAELLRGLSLFQQLRNEYRYKSRPLLSLQNSLTLTSDELHSLELMLYGRLRTAVMTHSSLLSSLAQALATLDVYCGLAHLARDGGYVRPEVLEGGGEEGEVLEVEAGRHPVVEARLYARYRDREKQRQRELEEAAPAADDIDAADGDIADSPAVFTLPSASTAPYLDFTPNDCRLTTGSGHLCLLTGPNMAGKCFKRGTLLLLYNGDTIAVEDVRAGDRLMGDDGTPRTVEEGSVRHYTQPDGTDSDSEDHTEGTGSAFDSAAAAQSDSTAEETDADVEVDDDFMTEEEALDAAFGRLSEEQRAEVDAMDEDELEELLEDWKERHAEWLREREAERAEEEDERVYLQQLRVEMAATNTVPSQDLRADTDDITIPATRLDAILAPDALDELYQELLLSTPVPTPPLSPRPQSSSLLPARPPALLTPRTRQRVLTRSYARQHDIAVAPAFSRLWSPPPVSRTSMAEVETAFSRLCSPPPADVEAASTLDSTAMDSTAIANEGEGEATCEETQEQEDGEDAVEQVMLEQREKLWQITPNYSGAVPFTVNGAHILVLVNNSRPRVKKRADPKRGAKAKGRCTPTWRLLQWLVDRTTNAMRCLATTYATQAAAQTALAAALAAWTPLEWEVSVDQFRATSRHVRRLCMLISCGQPIAFQNDQQTSLCDILTDILGQKPSNEQLHYMAWWLGLWLTDGDTTSPSIYQRGAPPPDAHSHHEVMYRLHQYSVLFSGRRPQQTLSKVSSAGWHVYVFRWAAGTVAARVLAAYGLRFNKHVPQALICDSIDVRRHFMAGIIDGDGYFRKEKAAYELSAKHRAVCEGYKSLAASLGMRSGGVMMRLNTNQTGNQYVGYRLHLSGSSWEVAQHCAAAYKRSPQPGTAAYRIPIKEPRCSGFRLQRVQADDYCGFAVDGNRRFLLADYTVTHNVSKHANTRTRYDDETSAQTHSPPIFCWLVATHHTVLCGSCFKSTYLRQNALLVLLASIGSFVPAARLRFTPVDRLFSRVGGSVSDDLSRDQSTFMSEMLELAAILHHATSRSLVIVDEVGRGTSTFDGLAIALASLEWLHDRSRCRALFATHYHELAMAQERLPGMSCWKMEVQEEAEAGADVDAEQGAAVTGERAEGAKGRGGSSDVHFLHRVVPGVVSSSYGIHVARLAGLPPSVSSRAEQVLGDLEGGKDSYKQLVRSVVMGTAAPVAAPQTISLTLSVDHR